MNRITNAVFSIFASSIFFILIGCGRADAATLLSPSDSIPYLLASPPERLMTKTDCFDFGIPGYGDITVGVRAGICTLFDQSSVGKGYGLDVRFRLSKNWNLECYGDDFRTNILKLGYRHALCFGASVLYYWIERPLRKHKFTPFLLGGISFDDITLHSYEVYTPQVQFQNTSPWLNVGCGIHYNFTSRLDIALEVYYALPLSTHGISDVLSEKPEYMIVFPKRGFTQGGVFTILTLNYKLL